MQRIVRLISSIAIATAAAAPAAQAAWPEKPIKIIVPFKAGGTSDQTARAFQAAIKENNLLPQPITVINVGGHFSVGTRQAKDAPKDGYTFMLIHMALMGGEGSGLLDHGYRDFEAVAATSEFCMMPVVRKDSGIKSVKQLLAIAKDKPDSLIYGANLGALNHMAGLMMQEANPGSKFRFVQIGGGTANFTALTGKQVNVSAISGADVLNWAMNPDGKTENPKSQIRGLAYMSNERHPNLPNIPTMKEQGYDIKFCVVSWFFAPKGTPKEAVNGMANAIEKAVKTPRIQKFYSSKLLEDKFKKGADLKKSLDETWKAVLPIAKLAKKK